MSDLRDYGRWPSKSYYLYGQGSIIFCVFFQLKGWLIMLGGSWRIWSADNALFAPKVWEPVL